MCILLLLDGMFYVCLLDKLGLQCYSGLLLLLNSYIFSFHIISFIYLFLAALGLYRYRAFSLVVMSMGYIHCSAGILSAVVSLISNHGF